MQNIQIISVLNHKATNITGISLSCYPVLAFNFRLFGFSTWWGGWIPCAKYIRSAKSPRRSIRGMESWNQQRKKHHPNGGCRWDFWTINYAVFLNENYEKRLMWRAKVLLERKKVNARVNKQIQEYLHEFSKINFLNILQAPTNTSINAQTLPWFCWTDSILQIVTFQCAR